MGRPRDAPRPAVGCVFLIEQGWPEALYLLFFLMLWNSLKFLLMGPISVILLIRARTREAIVRRRARRQAATGAREYAVAGAVR